MANPRTGRVKGQRGRPGQLRWRADPLILERVNLVRTLRAQGYTASLMLGPVNELMRRRGVPEIGIDTIYSDFDRVRGLLKEERAEAAEAEEDARLQHVEALEEIKRQAWRAFHSARDTSLNRSAYLNTIRATEESIGKYDGTLKERLEHSGEIRTVQSLLSDVPEPQGE